MPRTRLVLATSAVLGLALTAGVALGVNWITTCSQSHINNDDPIVFPNQPGTSHTHLFVGARTTNANSTPDSMRAGETSCAMQGDHAGYWEPKPLNYNLHSNGGALFYYTGSRTVRAFPDGLRMIVGNALATSPSQNPAIVSGRIKFKCGPGSGTETAQPPAMCSSGMMVPVIEFPNWWDGVRLDSPDHFSHMSYSRDAAHPIELPRIKAYIRHAVGTGPINFALASGPYYTYHVDFLNAWIPSELQRFIDMCMRTGSNCGTNPQ